MPYKNVENNTLKRLLNKSKTPSLCNISLNWQKKETKIYRKRITSNQA